MPLNLMIADHIPRCEGFGLPGRETVLCGNRRICARHMALATDPVELNLRKFDRCCKKPHLEAYIRIPGGRQ